MDLDLFFFLIGIFCISVREIILLFVHVGEFKKVNGNTEDDINQWDKQRFGVTNLNLSWNSVF